MNHRLTNGTGFHVPFTKGAVRKEASYHTGQTSYVEGLSVDGRGYAITGDEDNEFTVWMGDDAIYCGVFEEAWEKFKGAITR